MDPMSLINKALLTLKPLYRTVTRPIVTYASETWVLKENIIHKLLVWEENLKGNIWAYEKNQIWNIKNDEELDKMIKHENIVNYIKAQRLSWSSHVQRMPETGAAKKIFKWNPLTTRPRGRPKHRWEDNIIQDLGQMKIKIWITCVQDRAKGKVVVEKAKTSN